MLVREWQLWFTEALFVEIQCSADYKIIVFFAGILLLISAYVWASHNDVPLYLSH